MVLVVKILSANAGNISDLALIPGSGRTPGGGHGNLVQYSCLENSMDRGTWWATVHEVAKNQTRLKQHIAHMHNRFLYVLLWLDSSFLLIDE